MSETLAQFNDLPGDEAQRFLLACCGSRAWASTVAARRPYADLAELMEVADSVWTGLTPSDWLEAFAAHPRLGERGGHAPEASQKEQSRLMRAEDETLAALADENRRYEARFGHIFLMSATGHSARDILAALRRRLGNDAATEVKVAAEEQRKITRLRLERMLQE